MKVLGVILMGCTILAGCLPIPPKTEHDGTIRKNGGYDVLKSEAEAAFKTINLTETRTVDPTNYTSVIGALKPQIVTAHEVDPPVLMIQTMGGFNHRGVLVVLGTNSTHRPMIGHGWVRKELSPGVFEFSE